MALPEFFADRDTVVGPYDRCIFCDGDGDGRPLTDEHAIPVAIGGRLILKHATCVNCQDSIGRFEGKCLNGMFAPIRHYYGFKSARGKLDRQPVTIQGRDKKQHTLRAERGSHPTAWALPEFYSPTLLTGQEDKDELLCRQRITYFTQETMENATGLLKYHEATSVGIKLTVQDKEFARMLAKIAHCHCIAALGVDGFTPLLRDAILNGDGKALSRFIGCVPPPARPPSPSLHHQFTIRTLRFVGLPLGVLVLEMDLFVGFPEAPLYVACVGDFKSVTDKRLKHMAWSIPR